MRRFGKHRQSTTICFMCDHESSYVYSDICEKTSCLGESLVLYLHISDLGTLSQEFSSCKSGQEMLSCDFDDQTCGNTTAHV